MNAAQKAHEAIDTLAKDDDQTSALVFARHCAEAHAALDEALREAYRKGCVAGAKATLDGEQDAD